MCFSPLLQLAPWPQLVIFFTTDDKHLVKLVVDPTILAEQIHFYYTRRIFLAGNQLYDRSTNRWGCWGKKKLIDIFNYKQWLLSIYMKTKVVQHVPRINISIWHLTLDNNIHMSLLSIDMKIKVVQHVPRIDIWHLTYITDKDSHSHKDTVTDTAGSQLF